MEVDRDESKIQEIARSLDGIPLDFIYKFNFVHLVQSPAFHQFVNNLAAKLGIAQHPDPVITLKAVEMRIAKLKSITATAESSSKNGDEPTSHKISLSNIETGKNYEKEIHSSIYI